jgi:heme A synthase
MDRYVIPILGLLIILRVALAYRESRRERRLRQRATIQRLARGFLGVR